MSKTATEADDATGDEQTLLRVETGGDLWRSFTGLLDPLVDEGKFRFDAAGGDSPEVSIRAVDPANVGMVDLHVPSEAFHYYRVPDDTLLGLGLPELTRITDYARKGGNSRDNPGDPVIIEKVGRRIYCRVEPEDKWNRTGSFFEINPRAIREEPNLPELALPWEGQVDAANFRDALTGLAGGFDYVALSAVLSDSGNESLGDSESAYLSAFASDSRDADDGDGKVTHREDEFRTDEKILHAEEGEATPVTSLFSLDYLIDMAEAIVSAGFENVKLELGAEFPIKLHFGGGKWGIHGTYMLAPRIASEDHLDSGDVVPSPTWGDRFETDDEDEEENE